MRLYRRSFAASESFFATALMNDPELSVGGGPHRFIDFPPVRQSATLTSADLPALKPPARTSRASSTRPWTPPYWTSWTAFEQTALPALA